MTTINERFRELRKMCGKTQTEWGEILGMKTTSISEIENGRNPVSDRHLLMLANYQGKPINIDWLKTGEGDPFRELSRKEEITKFLANVLKGDDEFKERFISMLARLDDRDWLVLQKAAAELAAEQIAKSKGNKETEQ